jgi:hypothetical protein
LPIYVSRVPAPPFTRYYHCHFAFYVANPISSIPDLWQQEAVRALQQGKDVVSIRDVDPTKSGTIIASQASPQYAH